MPESQGMKLKVTGTTGTARHATLLGGKAATNEGSDGKEGGEVTSLEVNNNDDNDDDDDDDDDNDDDENP
ncbi:hypothetical protein E2C01_090275 [Portunus trituberculatus]|uniref:Uncharacterized protein n=1 Tax=Portunus trituberculatus TaxID=210409 RepID=A0A5B7JJU1_PORTR|nr:hypothetical protein [Portunus trituberculatus]